MPTTESSASDRDILQFLGGEILLCYENSQQIGLFPRLIKFALRR